MRVLLVASSYLPNLGGLQTVTSQLASGLLRRGDKVLVLTQRYPRRLKQTEVMDGVPIERLLFLTPKLRYLQTGRFDLALASLFLFPASMVRLLWIVARFKPDVVNLHFLGAPTLFVLIAQKWMRFALVVSLHGDDVESIEPGTRTDRRIFLSALAAADAVTACSQYLLRRLLTLHPGMATKSRVVHNGVEPRAERQNGIVRSSVIAAGRMVYKKGFDILLRAMAQLAHTGARASLKLIGDGPEREKLIVLARDLGLNETVKFCGPRSRSDLLQEIRSSRLVVVPSRQEPFGIVALEAMTEGRPVVATRVGGLPELLEGADAALVDPDDPGMLADAIRDILTETDRQPAFGEQNRELAAQFSISKMVDAFRQTYHQAIVGHPGCGPAATDARNSADAAT